MKIRVLSDLHLEFHNPLSPVAQGVDVIVCADDLAPIYTGAVRCAAEEWASARHILYVPGNHEYYGTDIDRARKQLAEECARQGVTLLGHRRDRHRRRALHRGRRSGPTSSSMVSPESRGHTAQALGGFPISTVGSDTREEPVGSRRTSRSGATGRSARSSRPSSRLRNATTRPQSVITHHAPTPRSISPRFCGNALNPRLRLEPRGDNRQAPARALDQKGRSSGNRIRGIESKGRAAVRAEKRNRTFEPLDETIGATAEGVESDDSVAGDVREALSGSRGRGRRGHTKAGPVPQWDR